MVTTKTTFTWNNITRVFLISRTAIVGNDRRDDGRGARFGDMTPRCRWVVGVVRRTAVLDRQYNLQVSNENENVSNKTRRVRHLVCVFQWMCVLDLFQL